MTTVLIVEDDPKIRANLMFELREEDLEPTAVSSGEDALAALSRRDSNPPDLLLLDVRLPGISGVQLVRRLVDDGRLPPTIIISGEASISETVEALKLGVHDFIEKPFTRERLSRSLRNTLEHVQLRRQVIELRSELEGGDRMLGESDPIEELRRRIAQAAPTDGRILIRGESGTGKELVADELHRLSRRSGRPFIKLNCAAIPSQLIEDELFGHCRGAFTGARTGKPGLFEEADGGTLFLDEIGDMNYELQSRLLRVLEDGRVRRLGETRDREVDVRVIAATNTDLEAQIQNHRFRQDLFFRVAHLPIDVPPLRDRRGDVRLLFNHFVRHYERRHRMRSRGVDEGVYPVLERHRWPGNVRELKNLCERLVVFGIDPITVSQLPALVVEGGGDEASSGTVPDRVSTTPTLREFRARAEKEYIERVLLKTGGNVAAAARLLGLRRTYLHDKITTLGVVRPGAGRKA